jgi:outer membrane protein assembly factor BamA
MLFTFTFDSNAEAIDLSSIDHSHYGTRIVKLNFVGNYKTQERYLRKWAGIHEGLILTDDLIRNAKQEIMDTGLFRGVDIGSELIDFNSVNLTFTLKEKNFNLLLPRLSRNGDGEVKTGIRLRSYNINGADQTLEILLQQTKEPDRGTSYETRFKYKLPLYSKPYFLEWKVINEEGHVTIDGFENIENTQLFEMTVAREWQWSGLSLPLVLETGLIWENKDTERPYPDLIEGIEAGQFNRLRAEIIYDDIHSTRYRRYGRYYSLSLEQGFTEIGSDYESNIFEFKAIGLRPLNRYDNLNYRLNLASVSQKLFDFSRYSVGSATTLRGIEDTDIRGDSRFYTNIEYVKVYPSIPTLRTSFFIDFGEVFDSFKSMTLKNLRYSLGVGLRWKIESYVKTDLFLDYGYDPESGYSRIYGGTSLAF